MTDRALPGIQNTILSRVSEQESLHGFPGQSLSSVVAQGLMEPGPPPSLTREGRSAMATGRGKVTKRVGGLVWCRVADLEVEDGRSSPVWGVHGPRGAHLLTRGRREWWLRLAGAENRESLMVPAWGAWSAMSSAAERIARARAPVWEQVRYRI